MGRCLNIEFEISSGGPNLAAGSTRMSFEEGLPL